MGSVYIFADAGRSGIDAVIETAEALEDKGFEVIVQAPEDGDWNDFITASMCAA